MWCITINASINISRVVKVEIFVPQLCLHILHSKQQEYKKKCTNIFYSCVLHVGHLKITNIKQSKNSHKSASAKIYTHNNSHFIGTSFLGTITCTQHQIQTQKVVTKNKQTTKSIESKIEIKYTFHHKYCESSFANLVAVLSSPH